MTTQCQRLFTNEEKLAEANRELQMRHKVYAWRVRQGKMKETEAARLIRLMTAIRDDYADRCANGPLFQ